MNDAKLKCTHCNIEFVHDETTPLRCPKCLRKSYLLPVNDPGAVVEDSEGSARWVTRSRIVAVAILLALFGLGFFLVRSWGERTSSTTALLTVGGADDESITKAIVAAGVSADAVWIPFSVTPKMGDLVRSWSISGADPLAGAENVLRTIQTLRTSGKLGVVPPSDSPKDIPLLDADGVATRVLAGEPVALSSYEYTCLLMATLRALAVDFVPAERAGVRNSATSVRKKEFGVIVEPKGRKLFVDAYNGVAAEASSAIPLTDIQFVAYGLALKTEPMRAKKQYKEAAAFAEQAQKLFPDSAAILFVVGMIKVESGMPEFGIEDIAKAVTAAPDALGYYNLGVAHVQGDSQFKAFQSFKKSSELDKDYAPAFLALGNLQIHRINSIPADQRESAIAEAQGYFDQAKAADPELEGLAPSEAQLLLVAGKKDEAKKLLEESLKKHPNRVDSLLMLGRIAMEEERMADAADAFEKAALADPTREDVRGLLAFAYAGLEDWERARKTLEQLVEAAPDAKDVRIQLAGALRELGRTDDTKRVLNEQMAKFVDDPMAPLLLAQLALDEKAFPAALELARKANKVSKSFEGLVVEILALWGAEKRAEIPAILTELSRIKENGRVLAAQTLLNQGELSLSEEVLRLSMADEPGNKELSVLLAMTVFALGRPDEATKIRDDAVSGVPTDEQEQLRKRFDQAIDVVRTSMEELRKGSGEPKESP